MMSRHVLLSDANLDGEEIRGRQLPTQHLEDAFDLLLCHADELLVRQLHQGSHIVMLCIHLRLIRVRPDRLFQPPNLVLHAARARRFGVTGWRRRFAIQYASQHVHLVPLPSSVSISPSVCTTLSLHLILFLPLTYLNFPISSDYPLPSSLCHLGEHLVSPWLRLQNSAETITFILFLQGGYSLLFSESMFSRNGCKSERKWKRQKRMNFSIMICDQRRGRNTANCAKECATEEKRRRDCELSLSLSLLLLLSFSFVSRLLSLQATEWASERPACTLASRFSWASRPSVLTFIYISSVRTKRLLTGCHPFSRKSDNWPPSILPDGSHSLEDIIHSAECLITG